MYEAIRQRIGEIIGEASMCWSETPKGVFNSDRASELIDEVMTHIQYPLEHPEDEKSGRRIKDEAWKEWRKSQEKERDKSLDKR